MRTRCQVSVDLDRADQIADVGAFDLGADAGGNVGHRAEAEIAAVAARSPLGGKLEREHFKSFALSSLLLAASAASRVVELDVAEMDFRALAQPVGVLPVEPLDRLGVGRVLRRSLRRSPRPSTRSRAFSSWRRTSARGRARALRLPWRTGGIWISSSSAK